MGTADSNDRPPLIHLDDFGSLLSRFIRSADADAWHFTHPVNGSSGACASREHHAPAQNPALPETKAGQARPECQITQQTARVEIIPGVRTEIWGYDGRFPGPTIISRTGTPAVVRHRNTFHAALLHQAIIALRILTAMLTWAFFTRRRWDGEERYP